MALGGEIPPSAAVLHLPAAPGVTPAPPPGAAHSPRTPGHRRALGWTPSRRGAGSAGESGEGAMSRAPPARGDALRRGRGTGKALGKCPKPTALGQGSTPLRSPAIPGELQPSRNAAQTRSVPAPALHGSCWGATWPTPGPQLDLLHPPTQPQPQSRRALGSLQLRALLRFCTEKHQGHASAGGMVSASPRRARQRGRGPSAVLEGSPLVPLLVPHAAHGLEEGLVGVPLVPVAVLALLEDVLPAPVPGVLVAHPSAGDGGSAELQPQPPTPWARSPQGGTAASPCQPRGGGSAGATRCSATLPGATAPTPPSATATRLRLQSPRSG